MPQTFQVLRCYKCLVFQVHQTKKSNKFECKLCGEKQSIKRHYGLGSGKECRFNVQKLNGIRGDTDSLNNSLSTDDENCEGNKTIVQNHEHDVGNTKKESKWAEYIDKTEIDANMSVNNDMYLGDTEVVLELPSKRRKYAKNKFKASYKFKNNDEMVQESIEDAIIGCKPNDNNIKLQTETTSTSKETAQSKFIPPMCSKMSKWAHYMDENKSLIEDEDIDSEQILSSVSNKILDNIQVTGKNKFDLQNVTFTNHSRVDTNTQIKTLHQSNPTKIIKNISKNQTQKLFSLCNDNDLDNILDI